MDISKVSRDSAADRWLAECQHCDWKRRYVHAATGSRKVNRHWVAEHQAAWIAAGRP